LEILFENNVTKFYLKIPYSYLALFFEAHIDISLEKLGLIALFTKPVVESL